MVRTSHNKPLLACATIAALAALSPGSPVTAQAHAGAIQRCASPDGTTLYTDRPCATFGAEPVAMPGELAARVLDSQQAELATGGTVDAGWSRAGRQHRATPGRRAPASGCAATPTQLAMDLQGAFALGEVNRIAESWHWVGLDHAASIPLMQQLERLAQSTVVDTRYYDATITSSGLGTWASAEATPAPSAGVMQLTLGGEGGHQVLDLQVAHYQGCYFVRF